MIALDKGGVEGEVGYFRRNHFVPLLQVTNLIDLNERLLSACYQDQQRIIGQRQQAVGTLMLIEQPHLRLLKEMFEISEINFPIVDSKGCIKVRNNWYSVGLPAGLKVQARVFPAYIEVRYEGKLIGRHQRCYEVGRQILELEHYLDVLEYKPGAFANCKPLEQWRADGRWTANFEQFWQNLQQRLGKQASTRAMIELLLIGREKGYEQLKAAIDKAITLGCYDESAVKHLMMADTLVHQVVPACDIGQLIEYERPLPQINNYDQLLEVVG